MDLSKYRRSGELSDLTVKVDNKSFNLHKFPLFVRSDYFKEICASSSSVSLNDFPGGASTFELIADYLYGKNVDVNANNVVPIRCAIDYLKMNDDIEKQQPQQKSLARMTEAVLFDTTHTAKAKRDYALPLNLLDQAIRSEKHAEAAEIHTKIIDSFADSLAYYLKTGSPYDNYGYYDKNQPTTKSPLSKDQMETLNHLPLPWMTEFIKSSQKVGLNDDVLAEIIKNYLDHNTGFNPNFGQEPKSKAKPAELIAIATDILKVEKKLNDIAEDGKKHEDKPHNLIKMAGDILGDRSDKPQNLIQMMSEVLYPSSSGTSSGNNKPSGNQGQQQPSKNDTSDGSKSNLVNIMSDVLKPPEKPKLPKKNLNNDEKLKVVSDVTKQLKELHLNPPFPMPWLMVYLENLNKLGADDEIKSTFNKWATDALNDLNLNNESATNELSAVDPDIMVKLANDVFSKDKSEPNNYYGRDPKTAKFIDLTDKYLAELNEKDALTPETFLKLASAVPKEKRESFDNLMDVLLNLLKKNKNIDPETKEKLFKEIDFHKLSEKSLEDCKKSEVVPPQYIAEAALALVAKLRKELEESKYRQPTIDQSRPHYTSSSGINRLAPEVSPSSGYIPRYSPTTTTPSRTRSIDPPAYGNRNQYSYPYQPSSVVSPKNDFTSSRGNKVVHPIPVIRSATESLGINKPTISSSYCKDNRLTPDAPGNNLFEHTSEFYTNDDCQENNDYYYSASYSFSTIF